MNNVVRISTNITLVAVTIAACSRPSTVTAPTSRGASIPTVQSVNIAGGSTERSLIVGETVPLTATARLSDDSERDITALASWLSDDPAVATVTSAGLVTAQNPGTARIRAVYQDAAGDTAFRIARRPSDPPNPDAPPGEPGGTPPPDSGGQPPVPPPPGSPIPSPIPGPGVPPIPPTVQRLTITGSHTVPAGQSAQFIATAHMSDGSQRDVTGSSDWSSSDTVIGNISQSGLLTALVPGTNVVTARYGGASASQPVQVTPF